MFSLKSDRFLIHLPHFGREMAARRYSNICAMVKSRYIGDGHPTFNRNPYNGYINPYYWVDEFIPYYMELLGVGRPQHISIPGNSAGWMVSE